MIPAVVRMWNDEEGWGIIESAETPGGCWAHFSAVQLAGYRSLRPGTAVLLAWEEAEQDGYAFRATRIVLPEHPPVEAGEDVNPPSGPGALQITIRDVIDGLD